MCIRDSSLTEGVKERTLHKYLLLTPNKYIRDQHTEYTEEDKTVCLTHTCMKIIRPTCPRAGSEKLSYSHGRSPDSPPALLAYLPIDSVDSGNKEWQAA